MHPRLVLGSLSAWILVACTTPAEPAAKSEPEPESKPESKPESNPVSLEGAPAVPGVEVLSPISDCPALATLPDDAPESQRNLVPTVELLRGIACQPALFGQSTPAILAALKAPEGMKLEVDRRRASITLTDPVLTTDILAVIGIPPTNLRFVGESGVRYFSLVDATGKPPAPWPPSELEVGFGLDPRSGSLHQYGSPPDSTTLDDLDQTIRSLSLTIPASALAFEHDEFAALAMVEALAVLALADDPNEVEPDALPSLGERFAISDVWGLIKPSERVNTVLSPDRTELLASDLAQALGLASPTHLIHAETDSDRLASAGVSPFVWQGLSVEVGLSKRPGVDEGLDGWIVDSVTVERAVPSK